MKRRLLFFVALLSTACSVIEIEDAGSLQKEAIRETLRLKSADSLFYHSQSGMYITPDSDALSLFTNCSSADSRPTHLAVKFYPKSREEQHYLSNLEGISVSYIPFGYVPVKTDSYRKSDLQNVPVFNESNPYTLTISGECEVDSVDGSVCRTSNETVTLALPVMYAIWPADMPLPDIEHQTVYEFRMPEPDRAFHPVYRFPIKFQTYDSLLDEYVPLRNIKVTFSYGGRSGTRYTDDQGCAIIEPAAIGVTDVELLVSVGYLLETPKWTISRDQSTAPIVVNLGTVGNLWFLSPNPPTYVVNCTSESSEYEIHRAVDYYHYSPHALSGNIDSDEFNVNIHAMSSNDPNYAGGTIAAENRIEIYNTGYSHNDLISVMLHEMGHIHFYTHHSSGYSSLPKILKESHANFVGWYVGEQYYYDKGFVKPDPSYEINYVGWQDWTTDLTSDLQYYSPFFVDLSDDYNQWICGSNRPNDQIVGVPADIIDSLAMYSSSLSECASFLRDNAGIYYSLSEINTYLNSYE